MRVNISRASNELSFLHIFPKITLTNVNKNYENYFYPIDPPKKETKLFNILRFTIVKFPQCPRKSELAKNSGNTASRIAELNDVHISGVM